MFLSNLPKLLAKPNTRSRGKPRRFMASRAELRRLKPALADHPVAQGQTRIDDLPRSAREALLRLFAGSLPAFKKLETVKRRVDEGSA